MNPVNKERAHLLLQLVQWSYDATKQHEDKISEILRKKNNEKGLHIPLTPEEEAYYNNYLNGFHKLEGNDRGTIMEMEYDAWDGVCDPPNDPIPNPVDHLDSILSGFTRVGFYNNWSDDQVEVNVFTDGNEYFISFDGSTIGTWGDRW